MTKISISNMTCGGCVKGVLATLRKATPGVEAVVNLGAREVQVPADMAAPLVAALRADGWEASEARS